MYFLSFHFRRGKQISRRATGVPGRLKVSAYEQTDIEPNEKARQIPKRSVSNVSSFSNPPSQPPPRLSSSPRAIRRLSAEPELPPSSGGSSENLSLPPQSGSRESSRQSSVNRLSGLSEDLDEQSNYEPIDSFLELRRKEASKVPPPQVEGSPKSNRSSMVEAPHYPAPLPPGRGQTKSAPEEDEDSDGYEPVQLAGQEDEGVASKYRDEVERAVLPLKPGAIRVGGGRERSPTVTQNRVSSESPPRSSLTLSSSMPASSFLSGGNPSYLHRPPIKDKSVSPPRGTDTKSSMPPMPLSPPPSPPVSQNVISPPPGKSVEQPVLPPKKKSSKNPMYETHVLPPQPPPTEEGIYEFDNLSPPPANVPIIGQGSPRRTPPSESVTTATVIQDDVYFDHLVSGPGPPPIPRKTHQTSVSSLQDNQPDGDSLYFDHLASGPPATPTGHQATPTAPPTGPRKPSYTSDQPVENSVYFDHLTSGPPPTPKTGQTFLPEPVPEEDQVYFDHLAQPVKPVQPASGPRLPPRRQSSLTSDHKPSAGVKKPVSF